MQHHIRNVVSGFEAHCNYTWMSFDFSNAFPLFPTLSHNFIRTFIMVRYTCNTKKTLDTIPLTAQRRTDCT